MLPRKSKLHDGFHTNVLYNLLALPEPHSKCHLIYLWARDYRRNNKSQTVNSKEPGSIQCGSLSIYLHTEFLLHTYICNTPSNPSWQSRQHHVVWPAIAFPSFQWLPFSSHSLFHSLIIDSNLASPKCFFVFFARLHLLLLTSSRLGVARVMLLASSTRVLSFKTINWRLRGLSTI